MSLGLATGRQGTVRDAWGKGRKLCKEFAEQGRADSVREIASGIKDYCTRSVMCWDRVGRHAGDDTGEANQQCSIGK